MSDESVRARVMGRGRGANRRQQQRLGRGEALALLASASLGRIVFTENALPTIRPVNHIVHNGRIIVRTHADAALARSIGRTAGADGVVVAYEADAIDPSTHLGWSVIITGRARLIRDPAALADYEGVLEPWVDRQMDCAVAIAPEIVTGLRLVGEDAETDEPEVCAP